MVFRVFCATLCALPNPEERWENFRRARFNIAWRCGRWYFGKTLLGLKSSRKIQWWFPYTENGRRLNRKLLPEAAWELDFEKRAIDPYHSGWAIPDVAEKNLAVWESGMEISYLGNPGAYCE
jgi:hypothetical protein